MSTDRFLGLVNGIKTWFVALSSSTGAPDANKIVMTDSTGRLDSTLMPSSVARDTEVVAAVTAHEAASNPHPGYRSALSPIYPPEIAVPGNNILLGRASAGAGEVEEINIGSGLTLTGTTLSSPGVSVDWPTPGAIGSVTANTGRFTTLEAIGNTTVRGSFDVISSNETLATFDRAGVEKAFRIQSANISQIILASEGNLLVRAGATSASATSGVLAAEFTSFGQAYLGGARFSSLADIYNTIFFGSTNNATISINAGYNGIQLVASDASVIFFAANLAERFRVDHTAQLLTCSYPVRAQAYDAQTVYTVSTLPPTASVPSGRLIRVSNGRKAGEGAGVGTGVWCELVGSTWCPIGTTTAVQS